MHTLKVLVLIGLSNITNDGAAAVIRGFHRLDDLWLTHCEGLNNDLFDDNVYPDLETHLERFSRIDVYGTMISPDLLSKAKGQRRLVKII